MNLKDFEDELQNVGIGWRPLLNKLIDNLLKLGWDGDIHQIKEKFGGLRFYIGQGSKEVHDAIDKAENESYTVCERCGLPGSMDNSNYWMKTLCQDCTEKRKTDPNFKTWQ